MKSNSTFSVNPTKRTVCSSVFTRLFILVSLLITVAAYDVRSQAVYTQDFNFTGALTSNGWTAHSAGGTNPISTTTGLTYSGHAGSGIGNAAILGNIGGEDDNQTFTSQSTNGSSVYASFLCNITDPATAKTGDYFFHLGSPSGSTFTAFSARVFARIVSGNVNFGLSNTSTATYGTTNFSRNTTYLIVLKYTIVTGTTADPVSMWVIPSGMPSTESNAGTAEVANTTTNGTDAIAAVGLRQGSATTSPQTVVDAIRVGTTWASVVPASGSAPSTQASAITFSNATTSSVTASWTAGNGDGRLVKINTTNSFTDPTGGQTYTANATYGGSGEQVVSTGTALSATVSSLSPGQTYWFRAYEYANTGTLYNVTTTTGNPASVTLSYPSPSASSMTPSSATAGGSSFTLTVTGTGFYPASVINWNGSPRTTTYVNATTLTASITTADIAAAGSASVTVTNPSPGGGTSSALTFSINASTNPLITVSSALTSFTTLAGTPSASQSYTVSGSNLTTDITVTPPTGFEIRTGVNAFSSSPLVLTAVGGIVSTTTIDVRFNPAVSGSFSGSITHVSSGAPTQSISVNGFALDAEPTSPSAIAFGTVTGNSIVVNTSGGNGSSRIIVIRQGSAVTYVPTDGASVTGVNASFTTALDQGSSNKISYDGTSNTVTVTGLAASTTYYFAVYEYNGSGVTTNYQLTGAGTASTTTLAAEPSAAATVTLTRIRLDSCFVGFSSGTSVGANRLVVLSTSPVSFVPTDGSAYTGASLNVTTAANLGSGNLLVFNGTSATSMALNRLSAGTTYYLTAYEYNGSGTGINYRTSTVGSLTFTMPSNISYAGGTYSQDFNGLPTSGSTGMTGFGLGPYYVSTPAVNATNLTGWQHTSVAGTSTDVAFAIDNGTSTAGGLKSYGLTGSTNRALGSLAAGASTPAFGSVFVNNTGGPLTKVTISYTGQQWRNGGSGTPNQLFFSYQVGGTDISTGAFSSYSPLNFQAPISGGAAGSLDGTQSANQVQVSATFTLYTNWLPGQTLVIRWLDNNDAGNDEGMAIDDLTFSAQGPTTPSAQDSTLTFINVLTTSMDVNWLNGDGTSRLLVVNTTNSFTAPTDGVDYTANPVYSGSGQQVVYNGGASVANVSGLTAGTTYYFRVYGFNGFGASTKYNTSTALDNPASQTTAAPSAATKLTILSVNNYADPVSGLPFNVVVQAQDDLGNPQTVSAATTVSLSVYFGTGSLSGTTTGIIPAGSHSVTISGVIYSQEDFGVQLQADATAGETLTAAISNAFNVLGVASQLSIVSAPTSAVVNTLTTPIVVQAFRNDFTLDPYFNGTISLSVSSGPGSLGGTLTQNASSGQAIFGNITFSQPGTYVLTASATGLAAANSSSIVVTLNPTLTELVVPRYVAGKTTASTHNGRVPFAVCLKIDNLVPNTAYDIKAGVGTDTTASTSYGSGNLWLGSAFGQGSVLNAFTTDATGSSGPFWIYLQPTASSTNSRFAPGFNHNLRIGYVQNGGIMPLEPNFVGTKLMTALDIATTALTTATTDDGAFLTGSSISCVGGKFILLYDNTAGTGDPISVYQSRTMTAPNTLTQSDLPTAVNDIYLQTSSSPVGDYAALIPIGANNPNGIRRIEVRNANNTLFSAATDPDGVWSASANTTTITRRAIASVTNTDAALSTLSVSSITATGESCTGALDGTATVTATSVNSPITYSWNTVPVQTTSTATGLAAGNYTVTVSDATACSQTASVTVAAPAATNITASGPTTFCQGGSVTLTVGSSNSYLWSNGATTQSITVSTSGNYSVTVSNGSCIATSLPVSVTARVYQFNGTVFSETMGAPTGTVSVNTFTGWQNTAPISFSAGTSGTDVRNTTVSAGYTGASGGGNVFFGTSGGNLKTLTVSGINTLGYSSLVLSYGLLRSDITNGMTVEVSTDGVSFTALTVPQPSTANSWQLMTVSSGIPAASNLRIRFSKNFTTSFRLDDIKITGTTSTPSISVTGNTTVCGAGSALLYSNIPSGFAWTYNGSTTRTQTVTSSGSYSFVATDGNGCTASATPVVFTVNPEPTASATAGIIACNGGSTTVNVTVSGGTAPYTNTGLFTVAAGSYSYIVTDAVGCDDTVSVSVTQPSAITGSAAVSACGSYQWSANGTTYTASGNYTATLVAANGCDSTATLQLTITPLTSSTTSASACDSYTWSLNGTTYTSSGTYSVVSGCRTDILNLTITTSSSNTTTVSACDSYTWSLNGTTYTSSGTYSVVNGCRTDILNLTITPSSSNTTTASACDSYTWSVNGSTYTSSGTYSSVNGCHTEILSLTITPSSSNITTATACNSYTWSVNNTTYTSSGTYSVVNGCHTEILSLTIQSCNNGVTLNLTAYLQGYYNGAGTMIPVLANCGFATATGLEADSITVELRDSLDPTVVVDAATVLLMADGTASATFSNATSGASYWIVIKHRSSIQTWSGAEVLISATTSYDFSSADTQAFGSNMKEMEPGVWAIYTADMNQDEFVDNFDFGLYNSDNLNFATGYLNTDLNGDSFVDNFDFALYNENNLLFVASVHP